MSGGRRQSAVVTPGPAAEPRATVVATPSRLFRATVLVLGLFLAGAAGYRLVEGVPWWDAFYMTVRAPSSGFCRQEPTGW